MPIGSAFAPSAQSAGALYAGASAGSFQPARPIGGSLPFPAQQAAGNIPFGGNVAQITKSYADAYNSALQMNQANYQNVLKGYQQTLEGQAQRQHNTQQQYYELDRDLQNKIAGVGQEEARRISDDYTRRSAAASQGLIDRGLGNTTVQDSIQRGIAYDENRARSALAEQIANLQAGYMRDVGLQRVGQHAQGSREYVDLSRGQLDFMGSVESPYPDAGLYASLAAQAAAEEQLRRGSGAGQARTGGGGGVSYGPAFKFGPSPGLFAGGGGGTTVYPDSGLGYNPAFIGGGGPTGYAGAGTIPVIAESSGSGNSFAPPQTGAGGGGAGGLGAALAGAATTARSALGLASEYAGSAQPSSSVPKSWLTGR